MQHVYLVLTETAMLMWSLTVVSVNYHASGPGPGSGHAPLSGLSFSPRLSLSLSLTLARPLFVLAHVATVTSATFFGPSCCAVFKAHTGFRHTHCNSRSESSPDPSVLPSDQIYPECRWPEDHPGKKRQRAGERRGGGGGGRTDWEEEKEEEEPLRSPAPLSGSHSPSEDLQWVAEFNSVSLISWYSLIC